MKGKIQINASTVKELRRKMGLSQLDMALACQERRLNVALSTIKRIETGSAILLRTARNIAEFFGCSLESLIRTGEISGSASNQPNVQASAVLKECDYRSKNNLCDQNCAVIAESDPSYFIKILNNYHSVDVQIPSFLVTADDFWEKENYADALALVDNAIALQSNKGSRFSLFLLKGVLLRQLNLLEKSIYYLLQAQCLSQNQKQTLECYLELAVSYFVYRRKDNARRAINMARSLADAVCDSDLLSKLVLVEYKLFEEQHEDDIFEGDHCFDYLEQSPDLTNRLSLAYDTYIKLKPTASTVLNKTADTKDNSVDVGLLFSQTGHLQDSEQGVIQTTLMAIDELNQSGGLLGKKINPVFADGASDEQKFADAAIKLMTQGEPKIIFGCSISSSRKRVEPLLRRYHNLLMYPFQYEGMESSSHITYVGPAPNQQALPAAEWLYRRNSKRFFLIGSDYVYPQTTNKLIKEQLDLWKVRLCGESYIPLSGTDFSEIIKEIKHQNPDSIILSLVGLSSNLAFCRQFYEAGLKDTNIKVMSLVLSENDLSFIPIEYVTGYYTLFSYFQNMDNRANADFVARYKRRYGLDARIGGYMESAYLSVYLWAKAVVKAGSFDIDVVQHALKGISHHGPGGLAYVDEENNHVWRQVRVARVHHDGEFRVIWSSEKPIAPKPFPLLTIVE